jgi:hypothetical protein
VLLVGGHFDEAARLGVPAPIADSHAGGAGQEVERMVVVVVVRRGSAARANFVTTSNWRTAGCSQR